ncbi:hypothetical protein C472_00489 [Halorubrum tebenquichense DSM 14210]|uniref:Uncharacterized protein n=1 Tax=Halorubrum tebenquichense DSM 14210 TaxID=1227485 RepID=M0E248_9EURY|nr:hypothetical protein C472_00489 [Halorubrum tebenquichense DSM 14210]
MVAVTDRSTDDVDHVPPKFQGTAVKADSFGLWVLTVSGQCSCGATDWGIAPDWKVPAEHGGGYMTTTCPECLGTMEFSEQWERADRLVSEYSELKPRGEARAQ